MNPSASFELVPGPGPLLPADLALAVLDRIDLEDELVVAQRGCVPHDRARFTEAGTLPSLCTRKFRLVRHKQYGCDP